ncbi:MAG TPA: nucleotidyltransferase domain-containing protein [Methanosarcinaceae archaeon]|nr:nucleotidyltransferase domain-containing protein [Methanosarcinaceae archaeon]
MDRKDVAKKFSDEILKRSGNKIISITLFGSVAKGIDTNDSDIDILIITDENQNISDISYDIVADFVIRYSELLSIMEYHINNMSGFAKKVVQEGTILYERDKSALNKIQTIP